MADVRRRVSDDEGDERGEDDDIDRGMWNDLSLSSSSSDGGGAPPRSHPSWWGGQHQWLVAKFMSMSSNRIRRAYPAAGGGGGGDAPTSAPERTAGSETPKRLGGRERYVAPHAKAAPARARQNNQHIVEWQKGEARI